MFKKALIATIVLCGATPTAWSQAEKVLYTGIESSTDYLTAPSSASGTWSITPCTGCSMLHLKLDASSEYFVGDDQVVAGDAAQVRRAGKKSLRRVLREQDPARYPLDSADAARRR